MTFRPGFMTLTIGLATLATPGIGVVAQHVAPAHASVDDPALEQRAEAELASVGWVPAAEQFPRVNDVVARIELDSGVRVLVAQRPFKLPLGHGPVHCQAASESLVVDALDILERELAHYPAGCLNRVRMRRVLLCRDLHEGWMPIPSLPNYRRTLLLDANATSTYLRRVVHHEVFHFVDFAMDEDLQRDPQWASLNPAGFEYGGGGRVMRYVPRDWQREQRGFVSSYAQSALEEDKAEVFSMWMSDPAKLRRLALDDRVIAAKTEALRQQMVALCPAMDKREPSTNE
jgi:hypothetical protein